MYVENIIRDLNDLIFDVQAAGVRVYENRRDAERSLSNAVYEEDKNIRKAYDKASDSLVDASSALESANDDFLNIEEMLRKIIEDIQMETLSAKVQGK